MNRLDKRTGEFTYIATGGSGAVSSTPGNHIKSLVRDGTDHLWIATYLGGLMRYNIASGSFRYFNSSGAEDERLLVNDLRRLVPEGDKGL